MRRAGQERALHLRRDAQLAIQPRLLEPLEHPGAVIDPLVADDLAVLEREEQHQPVVDRSAGRREAEPTEAIDRVHRAEHGDPLAVDEDVGHLEPKVREGREQLLPGRRIRASADFTKHRTQGDGIFRIAVHQSRQVARSARLDDRFHEVERLLVWDHEVRIPRARRRSARWFRFPLRRSLVVDELADIADGRADWRVRGRCRTDSHRLCGDVPPPARLPGPRRFARRGLAFSRAFGPRRTSRCRTSLSRSPAAGRAAGLTRERLSRCRAARLALERSTNGARASR